MGGWPFSEPTIDVYLYYAKWFLEHYKTNFGSYTKAGSAQHYTRTVFQTSQARLSFLIKLLIKTHQIVNHAKVFK
jgi:hypothetical protein